VPSLQQSNLADVDILADASRDGRRPLHLWNSDEYRLSGASPSMVLHHMIIDPDVEKAAAQFGLDPKLIQAVVQAEGDILKAVRCSFPDIQSRAQALDILCRSAVHAMSDFLEVDGSRLAFVRFWGARWAPVGAANDPAGLNANWIKNILALWTPT
jgi:hypothetical protein